MGLTIELALVFFLLRIIVPLILTIVLAWALRHLEAHWAESRF